MYESFYTLYLQSCYHCSTYLSAQPNLCSAPLCYLLFICCHLSRPPTSSLRITNRSFRYASPHLWNQLTVSFRQPCLKHTADDATLSNSLPTCSPLSPSITHSVPFQAQNSPVPQIFSTASAHLDCLLGLYWTGLLCSTVFHF